MMEGLKHANIVRLLGFSVVERTMNVVMEYVPGNSLDDVLQTMGPLHESLIRRYVRQILLGQCVASQHTAAAECNQQLFSAYASVWCICDCLCGCRVAAMEYADNTNLHPPCSRATTALLSAHHTAPLF